MKHDKSRRVTPWDEEVNLTATQQFLKQYYDEHYEQRHRAIMDSSEASMVNSFPPAKCPYCGSDKFKKSGRTAAGVQRYMCVCGRTFLPTTGTIFDEHKISISEWMEYCLNLFRHVSITADSWSNKNTFQTSRYWMQKLFLTLDGVQNDIVLSGKVWLDETYYSVRSENITRNSDGSQLRGISRNQICIGVATDKRQSVFLAQGTGRPSQKKTIETFRSHIAPGSTLVHDGESAHKKLVNKLSLESVAYDSKCLKGLPDDENPMNPVNRNHAILKHFLNSHGGFDRDNIQGYLNFFAFVTNPPTDLLQKVELVIKMAFQNPKMLRYRDMFGINPDL